MPPLNFDPRPIGLLLQRLSSQEPPRPALLKETDEHKREVARMTMARLRAERRGQDTTSFPPRVRKPPIRRRPYASAQPLPGYMPRIWAK